MEPRKKTLQRALSSWLAIALLACAALAQGRGFTVQVAALRSEAEAQAVIVELQAQGVEPHLVRTAVPSKGRRYRVHIGRFGTIAEAKTAGDRLLEQGAIKEFVVMAYDPPTSLTSKKDAAPTLSGAELRRATPEPSEAIAPVSDPTQETARNKDRDAAQSEAEANSKGKTVSAVDDVTTKPAVVSKESAPSPASSNNAEKSSPLTPDANSSTGAAPSAQNHTNAVNHDTPAKTELKSHVPSVADALADFSFANHHWQVVRRGAETDKNLRALYFVDALTGWAAGDAGAVYRTTDGGRTWRPLPSGTAANINLIQFIDWNNGWMLGTTAGGAASGDAGKSATLLFNTNNGGRTWTQQALPNVLSIWFTDAKNGWAVGENATVLRTVDGGAEWEVVPSLTKLIGLPAESSNYNYGFRDIFFLNTARDQTGQFGWMIGNFYGHDRSHIGGLFATADGGQTWRRIPFTLQTQNTSGRFTPGLLHSVRFTDPQTGSVTGEMQDGEGRFFFVLHTRDGGQSWEQFRTPLRATHSAQFINPTSGWMAAAAPREGAAEAGVYDTKLLRTDNGGLSWQSDLTARGRHIHGLFFLSPTKGWAVGDRGTILRYEDKKSPALN